MKKINLFLFALLLSSISFAQAVEDTIKKYPTHELSEGELQRVHENAKNFVSSVPPTGEIINIAEFMPMQGVVIAYPLGFPVNLVKELANVVKVTTLIDYASAENGARTAFINAGVNMDNVEFVVAYTQTYWTRDYGPLFVIDGNNNMGIVDFIYNRDRPTDDIIPAKLATHWNVSCFAMPLIHTGGNYMTDGYNISASTKLTIAENPTMTEQQIKDLCNQYLGLDDYYFIQDPMPDYIQHIDCWGKFLAVDKVLIGQVPQGNANYTKYEACAQFFENKLTPWGTKYRVYRVFTPGGGNLTPYTNSLILNDHVFVPIGNNATYNNDAIAVYEEAMPGYTIVPISGLASAPWINTDALHCRTHEVADLGMLFIRHYPLFDTLAYTNTYSLTADIRALSGQPLVTDSLLVYYNINDGAWQTTTFAHTQGTNYEAQLVNLPEDAKISYYLFAKDASQRREKHPYIGAFDPHIFYTGKEGNENTYTIIASVNGDGGTINPSGTVTVIEGGNKTFTITPNTGYQISQVLIDGVNNTNAVNSGSYTFTNVSATHTITTSFVGNTTPELIDITVNNGTLTVGEKMEHMAACGETEIELDLTANATIKVNGNPYVVGMIIPFINDKAVINIVIEGATAKTYTLEVAKALGSENRPIYIERWKKTLAVINNPNNNGEHTFNEYRWYRNTEEMPGEVEGYILLNGRPNTDYSAEVHSTKTGLWHELCHNVMRPEQTGIAVYPNPVGAGQLLNINLPQDVNSVNVNIYNLSGNLVRQQKGVHSAVTMPYQTGMYIIEIQLPDGTKDVQQVIVK